MRSTSRFEMSKQKHDSLMGLISSFYSGVQVIKKRVILLFAACRPIVQLDIFARSTLIFVVLLIINAAGSALLDWKMS